MCLSYAAEIATLLAWILDLVLHRGHTGVHIWLKSTQYPHTKLHQNRKNVLWTEVWTDGRMDTPDEFSKSIRTSLGDDLKLIMAAHSNGQAIIFLPCGFFYLLLLLSFFACLISAVADWMSAILLHMVWP